MLNWGKLVPPKIWLYGKSGIICCYFSRATHLGKDAKLPELQASFKKVMRVVPQPVVVVTTALCNSQNGSWLKRGVTCSSFSAISMEPPIISFAMGKPSRMHELLLKTGRFACNFLSQSQVGYAMHFSRPASDDNDQLAASSHHMDAEGIPILHDTVSALCCKSHATSNIGDHHVWYGEVTHAFNNGALQHDPLLYYARSYRSIGDETFIQAFENSSLPFEEWTHEAHLRMAWNYIREHGKEGATPLIKSGIIKFNERNKDKISRGYHETVTMFYIHMIADALDRCTNPNLSFEEFIDENSYVQDKKLPFEYYSDEAISKAEAFTRFLPPDKKELP